ncbi:hypothetical protein ACFV1L_19690, partial [Kitasatospora sp. NPDC059646]
MGPVRAGRRPPRPGRAAHRAGPGRPADPPAPAHRPGRPHPRRADPGGPPGARRARAGGGVTATVRSGVQELHELREQVRRGPSEKATEAQHAKGKLTARER